MLVSGAACRRYRHWRRGQTRSGLPGMVQLRAVEPAAWRQQRRRRQGAPEQHLAQADETHAVQVEVHLSDGTERFTRATVDSGNSAACHIQCSTPLKGSNDGHGQWLKRGADSCDVVLHTLSCSRYGMCASCGWKRRPRTPPPCENTPCDHVLITAEVMFKSSCAAVDMSQDGCCHEYI